MVKRFIKTVDTTFTPQYYVPINMTKRSIKKMKDMRLLCKENALIASTYIGLRGKVSFKGYRKEDAEMAIANSLYSVMIFDDKRSTGIARTVGNDRIAFLIEDMMMDPTYQKNRIGNPLMQKLQKYLAGAACGGVYIGLVSTSNCVPFHEKHGFLERPCDEIGSGMAKFHDPYEVRRWKK